MPTSGSSRPLPSSVVVWPPPAPKSGVRVLGRGRRPSTVLRLRPWRPRAIFTNVAVHAFVAGRTRSCSRGAPLRGATAARRSTPWRSPSTRRRTRGPPPRPRTAGRPLRRGTEGSSARPTEAPSSSSSSSYSSSSTTSPSSTASPCPPCDGSTRPPGVLAKRLSNETRASKRKKLTASSSPLRRHRAGRDARAVPPSPRAATCSCSSSSSVVDHPTTDDVALVL
mmetsp:Transcript_8744/g.26879  ORF Transcript_8744/g.26879 Transcript_8744/m.26879 type:complete len:224 (-) Transcript_8744:369-1040(-)